GEILEHEDDVGRAEAFGHERTAHVLVHEPSCPKPLLGFVGEGVLDEDRAASCQPGEPVRVDKPVTAALDSIEAGDARAEQTLELSPRKVPGQTASGSRPGRRCRATASPRA